VIYGRGQRKEKGGKEETGYYVFPKKKKKGMIKE